MELRMNEKAQVDQARETPMKCLQEVPFLELEKGAGDEQKSIKAADYRTTDLTSRLRSKRREAGKPCSSK